MKFPVYICDTYTRKEGLAFTGNPAAVLFLNSDNEIPDSVKVKIAKELNQPITAFVSFEWTTQDSTNKNPQSWKIRWFTIGSEVPLCGHGTAAAASVIFASKNPNSDSISFQTKNGEFIDATKTETGSISIAFKSEKFEYLDGSEKRIENLVFATIGDAKLEKILYASNVQRIFIQLSTEGLEIDAGDYLRNHIKPNLAKMLEADVGFKVLGVGVTIENIHRFNEDCPHFYSRFIAPWVGVDNDEVCGSAHSILGPFWSNKFGNGPLNSRFASERTGDLKVYVNEDKITLNGKVKIVLDGFMEF